ncbi:MAG: SAM-dependent methyltransferase [Acidobacteria bacterium]|nr:SAM-dependent methyltransferase [Acidobacteriota bacterium]
MIELVPIGYIKNSRQIVEDDYWGGIISELIIDESIVGKDGLDGIEGFSHLEVVFYFHLINKEKIVVGARHPRNNPNWPKVGILAQRGKNRPNQLGLSIVELIERKNNSLFVLGLDAVDNTPVLDIKPVIKEFLPNKNITQPKWSTELMENYWKDAM